MSILCPKNSSVWSIIQTLFLSPKTLSLVEISAKLGHIWGSKAPKKSVKGHFMDAALVCKTENFNLIATNAALMKLTIMYLHNNFNLQKVYWYYGSLVKMLHKLDLIWESYLWKTTQGRSKIIASGITLTFDGL